MQTADRPGQLFEDILRIGQGMIQQGPARTEQELVLRYRFVDTAWRHREAWRLAETCPIRDHGAHQLSEPVRVLLVTLTVMREQDMRRLGVAETDFGCYEYQNHSIHALCVDRESGRVRAYLPETFRDAFDEGASDLEYGLREGEVPIEDLYYDENGRARSAHGPQARRDLATSVVSGGGGSPTQSPLGEEQPSASVQGTAIAKGQGAVRQMLLSDARDAYLVARHTEQGDGRSEEDAGLILQFMLDFIGDKRLSDITSNDLLAFEQAMAATPDRQGIPPKHAGSLMARYTYGKAHPSANLKPMSRKRMTNVWHGCLHKFFKWLKDKDLASIQYRFTTVPANAGPPRNRDAWNDDELIRLFSLPLFTGCVDADHYWTPGDCFVQNELYWAYLLIFFTGMRNSEIGSLKVRDLVCEANNWHVDLSREERKTVAGKRQVPVPRLLIDLGLIDRRNDLAEAGAEFLFPEWKHIRNRKSGRDMPGHHLSKSWQYIKTKYKFDREDLTVYGGRHTRAGWYDQLNLPDRIRNRLLGHAPSNVAGVYGPKRLTAAEAKLAAVSLPIEEKIAEILIEAKLKAEYSHLRVVDTWSRT